MYGAYKEHLKKQLEEIKSSGLYKNERIIVRVSSTKGELFIEDFLPYKGESEWLEIDSNEIAFFLADHQDQLDTIEVMYE